MKTLKHALFASALLLAVIHVPAQVRVGVSVTARIAPPAIPAYVQPPCPADGYIWQPGYWAWDTDAQDYYWVPGVWIAPPETGYLWTPAYWGFEDGAYIFHSGYWGLHVGFYGGINYGYGYYGSGFTGGRWEGDRFRYNTAVVNVNKTVVHNTYEDKTVVRDNPVGERDRTSFNGNGGATAKPTDDEARFMNEDHRDRTDNQQTHENNARQDTRQFMNQNHGTPENVSMDRFDGNHFNAGGRQFNFAPRAAGVPRMGGGRKH